MIFSIKKPILNSKSIQDYVGLASFQKGEKYVLNQAIRQGKLKNHLLTALCQGHEFDPYRVEVVFNQEGAIEHSYCSCPVGAGGKCKHVAALLLSWLETPEDFATWEKIKAGLEAYDAATLIELIDLLDDKVKGSSEVIQAFCQNLEQVRSAPLAKHFRRIEEAFHVLEFPWYHPDEGGLTEIAFALSKIRSDIQQLLERQQFEEAIRLTQGLVQQILQHLDDHYDPWSNLGEELKGCVDLLDKALHSLGDQQELRERIFHILFRLVEEQLYRQMSIGAEDAQRVLLQHVQPAERDKIISWAQALHMHQSYQSLENFLIDLQKDHLEPDVYLTHYRQTGQVLKLVDSLLQLGRIKEAQQAAQQKEFISQTLPLADLFVRDKQEEIAEKLVLDFSINFPDLRTLRWLKDFYQQQNKLEQALEYAKQILFLSPQFSYYQDVRMLAQRLEKWPTIREEILKHFKMQQDLVLIEIYLDEKELDQALEAFERISQEADYSFRESDYTLLALRLAAEGRYQYPHFSLKIYQEMVLSLIEERNRESYQRACDYLNTIRSIYQDRNQVREWNNYLKSLMKTYPRLKALKDEMHHAHLI